jgi:hypothetical protein
MPLTFWVDPPGASALILYVDPGESTEESYEYPILYGTYEVTIAAYDKAGNVSASSPPITVTVPEPDIPSMPLDVTTESWGVAIRVKWTRLQDADMYQVWRADSAAGLNAAPLGAPTPALSYLDIITDDETPGTYTYYYKVQGFNLAGNGPMSSTWVPGTATGVNGDWIVADTLLGNRIIAGTASFDILQADSTVTQLLKTAATGTRWEIRGSGTGAPASTIRFIENVGGTDRERVRLQGSGLTVYGDGAQGDITMGRNATSGRGELITHAIKMSHDGTTPFINITTGPYGGFNGELRFGGGGQTGRIWQGTEGGGIVATDYLGAPKLGFTSAVTDGYPLFTFSNEYGGVARRLGLYEDGIGVSRNANEVSLRRDGNDQRWGDISSRGFVGGYGASYYTPSGGYGLTVAYTAGALGTTGGDWRPIAAFQQDTSNILTMRVIGYRGQNNTGWGDARIALWTDVDNSGAVTGSLQLGARGTSSFWALGTGGTADIYKDAANSRITTAISMHVNGTLSATSKPFVIAHPDPAKHDTHELRHAAAEAPTRGETLYTYVVRFGPRGGALEVLDSEGKPLVNSEKKTLATIKDLHTDDPSSIAQWSIEIPLPDYWQHLNERPRCLVQNSGDGWGRAKAKVNQSLTELTLLAEEGGEYTILLIGTRKDADARAMWDLRGAEKTVRQKWTHDGTLEVRASKLLARDMRENRKGKVTRQHSPGSLPPGLSRERQLVTGNRNYGASNV